MVMRLYRESDIANAAVAIREGSTDQSTMKASDLSDRIRARIREAQGSGGSSVQIATGRINSSPGDNASENVGFSPDMVILSPRLPYTESGYRYDNKMVIIKSDAEPMACTFVGELDDMYGVLAVYCLFNDNGFEHGWTSITETNGNFEYLSVEMDYTAYKF